MNFIFSRNPKFNKWTRWVMLACCGGAFFANTHYSVKYLQGLAAETGQELTRVLYATHLLTSVVITVICLCLMGAVTNPAFWGFMTEELQDLFKKLKGLGGFMGMASTLVILCLMFGGMFFLYRWDLLTTQFGLGVSQFPLFSTAAVPAWALVFAPDIGAIAWNMSSQIDTKTRGLRGGKSNQKQPQQFQPNYQYQQGRSPSLMDQLMGKRG